VEEDMPQYKVVDVTHPKPGANRQVTDEEIEQALNEQARQGWSLTNILQQFSSNGFRTVVTLVFMR
jgi:hypothetical protein